MSIASHISPCSPQDLIAVAPADLDGNGIPMVTAGGSCVDPPDVRMGRGFVWRHPTQP